MGDRSFPYDPKAVCDECGKVGAYDFYADHLCPECADKFCEHEDDDIDDDDLMADREFDGYGD